jgi:hypothetical protein
MAQAMSCSKGTIMSRLFHARRNMQKRLLDLLDHPPAELVEDLTGGAAPAGGAAPPPDDPPAGGAPARPHARAARSHTP